ncbi:MAG: hypothetical protein NVSMB18_33490 [Acetobacteraceae bacterium]
MSEGDAILEAVGAYYSGKLAEFGPTPRGVDWSSAASQQLRHQQFLRLLAPNPDASVVDLGCGYGDFLGFLRAAGHRGRYVGCDVAGPMVEAARLLHGESRDQAFVIGAAPPEPADYAIGSGILNVRRGATPDAWAGYVQATIDTLARAGRCGFGFNMLSLSSDPERRRPDLHYADPAATMASCIARYGRHVAVLQDYGLWEFTLLVRQPGSQTASPKPLAP